MSSKVGMNIMLAATLACLSYIPFEYVAKLSLFISILLFILDPIPPISRLLSILLVIVISFISKLYNQYIQNEFNEDNNNDCTNNNKNRNSGDDDEDKKDGLTTIDPPVTVNPNDESEMKKDN